MNSRQYDIDRMRASDERAAIGALSRAFYDDVMSAWAAPDPLLRVRMLVHFMGATLKDGKPFGETVVARRPDTTLEGRVTEIAGAAVWLPPGAYPRGNRRDLVLLLRLLPTTPALGRRVGDILRLFNAVDAKHPHEPHWYLALLGVDPSYQRTGAGSALLAPVLARCDATGLPAYLETQKPENVPWYGRFGFEVVDELQVGRCPPVWTLQRAPQ